MTYDLTGKTIIVTGANSGIGLSAAIQLARLGANVIMACRSAERGEAALEQARHQSGAPFASSPPRFSKPIPGWTCSYTTPPTSTSRSRRRS
jgi:NAD(P)-dependent dehydrogenase (short-subunit alcohol dehydrogenase family)